MLCERCKKNTATSHYTKIINGVKTESHLCPQCTSEAGILPNFEFAHNLFSLFSPTFSQHSSVPLQDKGKECPLCKSTMYDISRTGKIGCAKCYEVFREELMPYISRIHGQAEYKGEQAHSAAKDPIKKLRDELSEAIKKQEFEKACELRDKIKKLEGGGDE